MKKRVFALLLCLVLCLSLLPVGALADDCDHAGAIVKMPAKATCGESYKDHYKCTRCGALFWDAEGQNHASAEDVAQAKPAHTSDLRHVEADLDITCTSGGNYEYWICNECGQMFSENPGVAEDGTDLRRSRPVPDDKVEEYFIPALGHSMTYYEAVPHTCFEDGNVAYYACANCWGRFADPTGQEYLSDTTDYAAHVKTEYPAVAHTCDTDGHSYYFYCDVCKGYYDEDGLPIEEGSWVDPARHDYVEHPAQDPTCKAEGNVLYYSCENCDKVFDADYNETTLDAVTVARVPHSLSIHVDAVPKSCWMDGNIEYWQCDSCYTCFADAEGTTPVETVSVPASHEFEETEAKAATCTEDGNIAYRTCKDCGAVLDENGNQVWQTVIPATGHKPEKVEATATCTEAGCLEHYKCTVCEKLFKDELCTVETTLDELTVDALGHEYDPDGLCTRCGAVSPDTEAFEGESYVDVPGPQGWQRVVVRASAPQGVFPNGSSLYVVLVPVYAQEKAEIDAAVDAAREEGATPVVSYTFDVKVLNRSGVEVQPADNSQVNVSFALAETQNKNLDATVYHVKETEDGSKAAEALNTSVDGEAVTASTDGFSYYTVEFTYKELQYVLPGDESVPLSTVLETLNLSGSVQGVTVSNPELFSCEMTDGVWTVYSHRPFQSEEWMKVTLDGYEYTIKVTDEEQCKVTFELNGHGTVAQNPQMVTKGGKAVEPEKPTDEKLTFFNWYADQKLTTVFDFNTTINEDTTVYARWRCVLTYDAAPGTLKVNNKETYKVWKNIGDKATNNYEVNAREGYDFDGWYLADSDTRYFDNPTPINTNTTLYAKWLPIFRVVDDDGGTAHYGSDYSFTLNFPDYGTYSKTNSLKVYVAEEGSEYGPDALGESDYEIEQGSGNNVKVTLKAAYIETLADGKTYKIRFDTGVASLGDTEDSFIVSKEPKAAHTVSFEMNGHGTQVPSQSVDPGKKATRPSPDPFDGNFIFGGWYTDNTYKTEFKFEETPITKDTTVYAKWRCEVTFYTAHGTAPTTQTVDIGGTPTKPADMTWIGYSFGGWYLDSYYSGTEYFKNPTPINTNTTLYAKWNPEFKIIDGNGGTAHYGSTYAFTLNYYYPDWNKNNQSGIPLEVSVWQGSGSSRTLTYGEHYVISQDNNNRVVVTLRAPYIRTLTDGATYNIMFDTGLPDPPTDLGAKTGNSPVSKSPKTGDESNTGLWIAVACISALAVITIVYALLRKRKKSKLPPTPPENLPADQKNKTPKE